MLQLGAKAHASSKSTENIMILLQIHIVNYNRKSLFFQIFESVMVRRRIYRFSEDLNPLQIFFKSSFLCYRLLEKYRIHPVTTGNTRKKFYKFFCNLFPGGANHLYGAREVNRPHFGVSSGDFREFWETKVRDF